MIIFETTFSEHIVSGYYLIDSSFYPTQVVEPFFLGRHTSQDSCLPGRKGQLLSPSMFLSRNLYKHKCTGSHKIAHLLYDRQESVIMHNLLLGEPKNGTHKNLALKKIVILVNKAQKRVQSIFQIGAPYVMRDPI